MAELSGEPERALALLETDEPYSRFCAMVRAHGGDPEARLQGADAREEAIPAAHAGEVTRCDARAIGQSALALGAGRTRAGEPVHPGVGLRVHAKSGTQVERGDPLVTLLHAGRGLEEARALVADAVVVE